MQTKSKWLTPRFTYFHVCVFLPFACARRSVLGHLMPHWVEHKLNWQTEFLLSIQTKVLKTLGEKFTFFWWIARFDKVGWQCIYLHVPYLFVPFHFRSCVLSQKKVFATSSDGLLGLAKLAGKGSILLTLGEKIFVLIIFVFVFSLKKYLLTSSDGLLGLAKLAGKGFILLTFKAFQRSDA